MKLLIMCEGSNEKTIVELLLEQGLLRFGFEDLLDQRPFHARQIVNNPQVRIALNSYPGEVEILRIGDKQSDRLIVPTDYKKKIVEVKKYCTKPELEMLLIISEGLSKEFEKEKSNKSPKEFAKANIKIGKRAYDNSSRFYEEYFGTDSNKLVDAINIYQRIHGKTHSKDEYCLADLLK